MNKKTEVKATDRPSYLPSVQDVNTNAGMLPDEEGIISPPRLKMCQSNTVEVVEGKAGAGEFFSQAHDASIGLTPSIIPIQWQLEWMMFYSDDEAKSGEGEGLKWRTTDPNDKRVIALGEQSYLARNMNLLCLGPVGSDKPAKPFILTFSGKSAKAGKDMYNTIRASDVPLHAMVFELNTKLVDDGPTKKYRVMGTRFIRHADEDEYAAVTAIFKSHADRIIQPSYDDGEKASATVKEPSADEELPF